MLQFTTAAAMIQTLRFASYSIDALIARWKKDKYESVPLNGYSLDEIITEPTDPQIVLANLISEKENNQIEIDNLPRYAAMTLLFGLSAYRLIQEPSSFVDNGVGYVAGAELCYEVGANVIKRCAF